MFYFNNTNCIHNSHDFISVSENVDVDGKNCIPKRESFILNSENCIPNRESFILNSEN